MPEITITESQRERLEAVQSDIEAAYIDTYGHVRTTDALQYLLDTYTPPEQRPSEGAYERIATAEFPLLQQIAAEVEGVPGSGIDTETMRGELLSALGVAEFAARLDELDAAEEIDADAAGVDGDAEDDETGDDEDVTADESPAADDQSETDEDGDTSSAADGSEETADGDTADSDSDDGDTAGSAGSTPTTDGPGSVLSAANQLLDTHEDKWREGGGEEPYEVDLPDGTTEEVRTKDDVRGLLFKHY